MLKKHLIAMATTLILLAAVSASKNANAQKGPKVQDCYETRRSGNATRVIARHSGCLVGRDSNGNINFIEWKNGTATTGLRVWERLSNGKCFSMSEDQNWSICAD